MKDHKLTPQTPSEIKSGQHLASEDMKSSYHQERGMKEIADEWQRKAEALHSGHNPLREEWEEKFDGRFDTLMSIFIPRFARPEASGTERLKNAAIMRTELISFIKELLSLERKRVAEIVYQGVDDYFKGLVVIPFPHATKHSLITHLESLLTQTK